MKKRNRILSTMIIGIFGFLSLVGQTEIGVFAGLQNGNTNLDGVNGKLVPETHHVQSGLIGIQANHYLDERFSLSSGIQFSKKGFDISESTDIDIFGLDMPVGVKVATRLNTIEIPLHLRYNVGNSKYNGYVTAGPYMSHATSGTIRTFASTIIDIGLTNRDIDFNSDRFSKTTIGGSLGLGGEMAYGSGKFFGEVSYQKDFTDFMYEESIDLSLAHKAYAFKLGYKITL